MKAERMKASSIGWLPLYSLPVPEVIEASSSEQEKDGM